MNCLVPWGDLIRDRLVNGHMPTYFLLEKAWVMLAGDSEVALRLPSVLMVAVAVLPFLDLATRLFGRRPGQFATLIFCLHQSIIWMGQTARPYGFMLLCSVVAAWSLVRWWTESQRRWLIVLGAAVAVGMSLMPLFALAVLGLLAGLIFGRPWRKVLPPAAVMLGATLLMAAPALLVAKSQSKFEAAGRAMNFQPMKGLKGIRDIAFGAYDAWAPGIVGHLSLLMILLLLVAFIRLERGTDSTEDSSLNPLSGFPRRAMVLSWFLLPATALTIAQAITGRNLVGNDRYYVPALGGLVLLIGRAAWLAGSWPWLRRAPWLPQAVVLALLIPNTVAWWLDRGEGTQEVAAHILKVGNGKLPQAASGHVRWLNYELRKNGSVDQRLYLERLDPARTELLLRPFQKPGEDQQVFYYKAKSKNSADRTALEQRFLQFARNQPTWLFLYYSDKDLADTLLTTPPPGWKVEHAVEVRDARAGLLVPPPSALPDPPANHD